MHTTAKLFSSEERSVLELYKLSTCHVLDARFLSESLSASLANSLGKPVIMHQRTCTEGHRLFDQKGQCLTCVSSAAKVDAQVAAGGYLFAATSHSRKLTVVGVCKNLKTHLIGLDRANYAGISDWTYMLWICSEKAGQLLRSICAELSQRYQVYGGTGESSATVYPDIFCCSPDKVLASLRTLQVAADKTWQLSEDLTEFAFDSIVVEVGDDETGQHQKKKAPEKEKGFPNNVIPFHPLGRVLIQSSAEPLPPANASISTSLPECPSADLSPADSVTEAPRAEKVAKDNNFESQQAPSTRLTHPAGEKPAARHRVQSPAIDLSVKTDLYIVNTFLLAVLAALLLLTGRIIG